MAYPATPILVPYFGDSDEIWLFGGKNSNYFLFGKLSTRFYKYNL